MSVKTINKFGKLSITDNAIAMVASHVAGDCYGVVSLVSRKLTDSIAEFFGKKAFAKGVKVVSIKNKINIEIYAVLKDGINTDAVCDSIKSAVKYNVETFTGMRVDDILVYVVGVRV